MALTNLEAAVNSLFAAKEEKGFNATKATNLASAETSLIAAIAGDSDLSGSVALAAAAAAIVSVQSAINAGNNLGDPAGLVIMSEKANAEYFHTQAAYDAAQAALAAPTV